MKTGTLLKRWSAMIVALLLTVVLFAVPAFAEDATEVTTAPEEVTTVEEVTTAHDHEEETTGSTSSTGNKSEEKGMKTGTIVTLIVVGVLVVVGAVLGIKFREKVGKFLRVYKSETKKIVWLPWDQTKKSTLVVLLVLVICALAICLLDFALGQGYLAFLKLF